MPKETSFSLVLNEGQIRHTEGFSSKVLLGSEMSYKGIGESHKGFTKE